MRKRKKGPHIVLRIKPAIKIRWEELDVVSEHNRVFDETGSVAVGKYGASWPQFKCDDINTDIEDGAMICLFIVWHTKGGYKGYRARIREVFLSGSKKNPPFPAYYNSLGQQRRLADALLTSKPSMWFHLSERLKPYTLMNLRLLTNDRPLLDVLSDCRSTIMLVNDSA
jgi:hypothetical protein